MRPQKRIRRLIAIVLLIALIPKTGAILYYHHWAHGSAGGQATNPSSNGRLGVSCDCFGDFSLPFIESAPVAPAVAMTAMPVLPVIHIYPLVSLSKLFRSLRAPPPLWHDLLNMVELCRMAA